MVVFVFSHAWALRDKNLSMQHHLKEVLIIQYFYHFFPQKLGDLERAENYFKIVEERATGDPENMSTVVMNK